MAMYDIGYAHGIIAKKMDEFILYHVKQLEMSALL